MHASAIRPSIIAATAVLAFLLAAPQTAAQELEKLPDGIMVPVGDAFLKVAIRADGIVRVAYARDRRRGS